MNFYRVVFKLKSHLKLTLLLSVFLSSLAIPSHSFVGTRVQNNRGNQTWELNSKVVPSTRTTDAAMGWSSDISEDGSTMVIGARLDSYDETGSNYLLKSGAAYVYVKSGGVWVFQQKLVDPVRTAEDEFGISVSISGDTIVVGSEFEDYDEAGGNYLLNAGAAYVYTRSAGVWSFQKKLVGAVGTNHRRQDDNFGHSVAISGNTIAVGVWYQDHDLAGANYVNAAGAVNIYTGSGASWSLQQKLIATTGGGRTSESRFGDNVALEGDTLVVGSYNHSLDENGANSVASSGAAYILTRSGGVWTEQQKLVGSGTNGRVASDNFGSWVGISGNTVVIGAQLQDYDYQGTASITNAGAAYVYEKKGSVWELKQKLTSTGINGRVASDMFGARVAISGDTIAISSFNHGYDKEGANALAGAGAVFVYKRTRGVWRRTAKLVGEGTNGRRAADVFGSSVSVAGDTVLVGARGQDYDESGDNVVSNAGAGFVFQVK